MNTKMKACRRMAGFTLVELLVGVLLGLILLAGVVQVYLGASEVNRERQSMSAVTENVRFAMQHMTRELRRADTVAWDAPNQELQATLHGSGDTIAYRLRQDGDRWWIEFRPDGSTYQKLVSGISAWELEFGEYVTGSETIQYHTTPIGNVVALRIGLTPFDDTRDFNELEMESWQDASGNDRRIWTTIGLRNPTLVAIQDGTGVFAGGGGSGDTGDGDTGDGDTGDDSGGSGGTCETKITGSVDSKSEYVTLNDQECALAGGSYTCASDAPEGTELIVEWYRNASKKGSDTVTANCSTITLDFD